MQLEFRYYIIFFSIARFGLSLTSVVPFIEVSRLLTLLGFSLPLSVPHSLSHWEFILFFVFKNAGMQGA